MEERENRVVEDQQEGPDPPDQSVTKVKEALKAVPVHLVGKEQKGRRALKANLVVLEARETQDQEVSFSILP